MLYTLLLFSLSLCVLSADEKNSCPNFSDYPTKATNKNCYTNPDVMAKTPTLIKNRGYSSETHLVTTPDGYILKLFRMVPLTKPVKNPVLLANGIASDSGIWLIPGNNSIAFNLAQNGYDVWLMNQRGTQYSRTHVNLTSSKAAYWNYTLDTTAANDIPSALQKVADVTGKAGSITFIGHSKGATLVFMWASGNPKEAQKLLAGIVALAPGVFFEPVAHMAALMRTAPEMLEAWQVPVLFPKTAHALRVVQRICTHSPKVCVDATEFIAGVASHIRPDDLLLSVSQLPLTIESSTIMHFCQLPFAGQFQKFDFGKEANLERYGQVDPPLYDLGKITVPLRVIYGRMDSMIRKNATERLLSEYGGKNKISKVVPLDDYRAESQFNHVDLVLGKYVQKYVVSEILEALEEQFNKK